MENLLHPKVHRRGLNLHAEVYDIPMGVQSFHSVSLNNSAHVRDFIFKNIYRCLHEYTYI